MGINDNMKNAFDAAEQFNRRMKQIQDNPVFQAEVERQMERERQRQEILSQGKHYASLQQRYDIGSVVDRKIIDFIQSGKADEYIGYKLKYDAEHIIYNIDQMVSKIGNTISASQLYALSGEGMTQAYMKDFVSALWVIKCVKDKILNSKSVLFNGVKGKIKAHTRYDEYISSLMSLVYDAPTHTDKKAATSAAEQEPKVYDDELRQRVDKFEQTVETLKEDVETLKEDNKVHNDFIHQIRGVSSKADDVIRKNHTRDDAMILLSNNAFMLIMRKAVTEGFCTEKGWQFKWKKKKEAAFFAAEASYKFELSSRKDHDGGIAISWKPFEALFDEEDLRLTYNDIQQCKTNVDRQHEIRNLFK